jgi:ferredoxin
MTEIMAGGISMPNTPESGYSRLVERLNRAPQGAPSSANLDKILSILFTEREAELVTLLPIKPFTAAKAARIWKMELPEARQVLDGLANRALLVDAEKDGEITYVLPPPMAGFFEFSMMRLRDDVNQDVLAELYYQYCTVDDDFMRELIAQGDTQLGRVFVNEPVLQPEIHVLDYERASEVIRTADPMGISICYCRTKMKRVGRGCDAPQDICMTFNTAADSLIRHGFARKVDVVEGLDLLQVAYEHNLVQFGENNQEQVNFICNCCGCCCEAMIAARRFALTKPIHTTNFLPEVNQASCTGCGMCVSVCPVEAMTLVSANDYTAPNRKMAKVNTDLCLGCGVCARACPSQNIHLAQRPERVVTPFNSAHRTVLMALERGKLQDVIFDNRVLWSHRALATFLGVLLKLPPLKQVMASEQMRSKYLDALFRRYNI